MYMYDHWMVSQSLHIIALCNEWIRAYCFALVCLTVHHSWCQDIGYVLCAVNYFFSFQFRTWQRLTGDCYGKMFSKSVLLKHFLSTRPKPFDRKQPSLHMTFYKKLCTFYIIAFITLIGLLVAKQRGFKLVQIKMFWIAIFWSDLKESFVGVMYVFMEQLSSQNLKDLQGMT